MNRFHALFTAVFGIISSLHAGERFLLSADRQVIEINRLGEVIEVIKHAGHGGIYDAKRLPDGGIVYAHRGGLALFDAEHRLIMEHAARPGAKGAEANSVAVGNGGAWFALMDSGVPQIRVIDRAGTGLSETPLPDLAGDPLHFRYRMIREAGDGGSFWVCQYGRKTLIQVEKDSGRLLTSVLLDPMLAPTATVEKCFATLPWTDGSQFVSTSTGLQLLHLDRDGKRLACWTHEDLGLRCRYLLGMSRLANRNLLIACGDYHMKSTDEGRDLLAEIDVTGKVVWKLTRDRLIDQIEGVTDSRTGIEEIHVTHVHAYDSEDLAHCLNPTP